jgi:hypothetical protein
MNGDVDTTEKNNINREIRVTGREKVTSKRMKEYPIPNNRELIVIE